MDTLVSIVKYFLDTFMGIGARLREERELRGMSQSEFAALTGVHRKSQENYEADRRQPDAAYFVALAAAGADVLYILTGERSGAASALTADERELLALFRAAPLVVKAAGIGALQGGSNQTGKQTTVTAIGGIAAGRSIKRGK
jgi:transcriptional regulator with XRE-family HTH domain